MMRISLVLVLTIACCEASVDFSFSTLYDIYDFVGKDEVPIPRCDYGCLIFASTLGDGFNTTSGFDPYAANLIIVNNNNQEQNYSITDLSQNFNEVTSEKIPLTIWGGKISVLNQNTPADVPWQIVLYVIEKSKAAEFSYSVYDALKMKGVSINPNGVVTVMSADPFTLSSTRRGSENGVVARLTGFENVRDQNGDNCPRAFYMPTQNPFPGFNLNVNGPIISLLFNERNAEQIDATMGLNNFPSLGIDGFITSPGYNGCSKPQSKGVQSFRSPFYEPSASFLLSSSKDLYDVSIDVLPNLDTKHSVIVNDVTNGNPIAITGYKTKSFDFDKTKNVEVAFNNLEGDQGFLLIHTIIMPESTSPSTTSAVSSTSTVTSSSTTSLPLTTSGSNDIGGLLPVLIFVIARFR